MKSLIIHAGLHKTGSTSIQNFLAKNRRKLEKNKQIYYPSFPFRKQTFGNHSAPIRLAFSEKPEKMFFRNIADGDRRHAAQHFLDQLRSYRDSQNDILLSAEAFSQLPDPELEAFKAFFAGWKIKVILYVRPAYSYHCSAIQEQIKNGRSTEISSKLVSRSQDIVRLKKHFDDIAFFHFGDVAKSNGPVKHFVDYLDLDLNVIKQRRDNMGLSNEAIRIANIVNKHIPLRIKGSVNPEASNFSAGYFSLSDKSFRLTESEFAAISDAVREENAALSILTGLDFSDERYECLSAYKLSWKNQIRLVGKIQNFPQSVQLDVKQFVVGNKMVSRSLFNQNVLALSKRSESLSETLTGNFKKLKSRLKGLC